VVVKYKSNTNKQNKYLSPQRSVSLIRNSTRWSCG